MRYLAGFVLVALLLGCGKERTGSVPVSQEQMYADCKARYPKLEWRGEVTLEQVWEREKLRSDCFKDAEKNGK